MTMMRRLGMAVIVAAMAGSAWAVTSEVTKHSTAAEFLKGKTDQTQVDSEGTIRLARQSMTIDFGKLLEKAWAIHSMAVGPDGSVFVGTSPNGQIFRVLKGKAEQIYPIEKPKEPAADKPADTAACEPKKADAPGEGSGEICKPKDAATEEPKACEITEPKVADPKAEKPADKSDAAKATEPVEPVAQEYVFAMTMDRADRLVAGISGKQARLIRFENGQAQTLAELEGVKYIHAIAVDGVGNLYLGTGPDGKIFRLDPFGKNPQVVYAGKDHNILSLAVDDKGTIYAGCDERGLVLRIAPDGKMTVLYDSEQNEITALALDEQGNLYAAATSAEVTREKVAYNPVSSDAAAGRPDDKSAPRDKDPKAAELKIPNTEKPAVPAGLPGAAPKRGSLPKSAGHIYRIDPQGTVTDLFSDMSVLYALRLRGEGLLVGTGNAAQVFTVDPATEKRALAYEEKLSTQITALAAGNGAIWIGCANPAKLIRLSDTVSGEGIYLSELIDAGQPARWGKLQVEATIPEGCSVWMTARSGNVGEPNDPSFSPWSQAVELKAAATLNCPVGRFGQYKLTLKSGKPDATPRVDAVTVAHVVGNLAPVVNAVNVARVKGKPGMLATAFEAVDRNKDTLVYKLELRRQGRTPWILLKDELLANTFEWDSQTVEDGRYELRVTADDRRSNSDTTALTASRISETFVVDNTAPEAKDIQTKIEGGKVIVQMAVEDALSVVSAVNYTVDSNDKWMGTIPEDLVFDTTRETFVIELKGLEPGEHVLAIRMADDVGNTGFKTVYITIPKAGGK
jgi:hypothetical protein